MDATAWLLVFCGLGLVGAVGACVTAVLTMRGLLLRFAGQAADHNAVTMRFREMELESKRLALKEMQQLQALAAASDVRGQRQPRPFDANRVAKGEGKQVVMGLDEKMPDLIDG